MGLCIDWTGNNTQGTPMSGALLTSLRLLVGQHPNTFPHKENIQLVFFTIYFELKNGFKKKLRWVDTWKSYLFSKISPKYSKQASGWALSLGQLQLAASSLCCLGSLAGLIFEQNYDAAWSCSTIICIHRILASTIAQKSSLLPISSGFFFLH